MSSGDLFVEIEANMRKFNEAMEGTRKAIRRFVRAMGPRQDGQARHMRNQLRWRDQRAARRAKRQR